MAVGVRNQHIVSQTLSRAWCVGAQFDRLVLDSSRWEQRGPRAFGRMEWFVRREDSAEMELLWKITEDRIPLARSSLDNRTALESEESKDLLREVVALHLVRSNQFFDIHNQVRDLVADRYRDDPGAMDFLASQLFLRRHKFRPFDPPTWRVARELLFVHFEDRMGPQSEFFVERLKANFKTIKDFLATRDVEVGVAAEGSSFVLGDTPALTVDVQKKRIGFLAGVPLNAADLLVMPLSPNFTLSFVSAPPRRPYIEVPVSLVHSMNDWQVAGARRHVIARPGDGHRELTAHYVEVWRNR